MIKVVLQSNKKSTDFSLSSAGLNAYSYGKKINLDFILHVKITNYRWTVGLIVNDNTIQHLVDNTGKYLCDHAVEKTLI